MAIWAVCLRAFARLGALMRPDDGLARIAHPQIGQGIRDRLQCPGDGEHIFHRLGVMSDSAGAGSIVSWTLTNRTFQPSLLPLQVVTAPVAVGIDTDIPSH